MASRPIYLDHNSTTPVDPEVLEAMLPYFSTHYGNPSNTLHSYGTQAANAIEQARIKVGSLVGASARDIIFTSGATESNNLAILGVSRANKAYDHVVTAVSEHKAVLETCRQLESEGVHVTYLPVDHSGIVSADDVAQAITPTTLLVSIMTANNEVGTLQPIQEIGDICEQKRVLFHTDAVQAVGRIPVDVDSCKIDLLSMSAHKMYGPKGVGALFVRDSGAKFSLKPLAFGGGQEKGFRPGTQPVPQIVGFGFACEKAKQLMDAESCRIDDLRNSLKEQLLNGLPDMVIHGHPEHRLPGLLNVGFPETDGDVLIHLLTDVAVSQGSSCTTGAFEPSHVLRAIGVSDDLAKASVRFGVGRFTTEEEVARAVRYVISAVERARDSLVRPHDAVQHR